MSAWSVAASPLRQGKRRNLNPRAERCLLISSYDVEPLLGLLASYAGGSVRPWPPPSEPFYSTAADSASTLRLHSGRQRLPRRLSSCADIVPDGEEKWYADTTDSVSQRLDCAFFGGFPELCDALVEAHENFNETAEEACCARGGGIRAETPAKHATRARYDVKQPSSRDARSASAARALSLPQSPSPDCVPPAVAPRLDAAAAGATLFRDATAAAFSFASAAGSQPGVADTIELFVDGGAAVATAPFSLAAAPATAATAALRAATARASRPRARRRLPAARRRRQHARRGADVGRPHRRLPRRRLGDGGVRRARRGERRRRVHAHARRLRLLRRRRPRALSLAVDGSDLARVVCRRSLSRVPDTAWSARARGGHRNPRPRGDGRDAAGAPGVGRRGVHGDAVRAVGRHGRRPLGLLRRRVAGEAHRDPPNAFEVVTTDLVSAAQRPGGGDSAWTSISSTPADPTTVSLSLSRLPRLEHP